MAFSKPPLGLGRFLSTEKILRLRLRMTRQTIYERVAILVMNEVKASLTDNRLATAQRRINFFRRNRQIFYSYANGVFDRIGDCRRHRRDRIFADAFNVVGSDALIACDDGRFEWRNIFDGGNL